MKSNSEVFGWTLIVALALTAATCAVVYLMGSPLPGGLEASAVMTSYGSTILFVLQRRQAYLWGAVTTLLYSALFWQSQLPASAAVQIYLLGALAYGYWRWGPDEDTRPVTFVSPWHNWLVYGIVTGLTWAGASAVSDALGSPLAGWDALILGLSILAQWLLDNKKFETWLVWIVVNVIAVPVYWAAGLDLVAIQYVLFGVNAVWALGVWAQSMRRRAAYTLVENEFSDQDEETRARLRNTLYGVAR